MNMATIVEFPGWRSHLIKGDKGQIVATVSNAIILIDHDPTLRGMFGFDELGGRAVILRPAPAGHELMAQRGGAYPRGWDDGDADAVLAYLQRCENSAFTRRTVDAAIGVVATAHPYHPIRQYLAGLTWDGKPRLGLWLQACFGSPDTEYVRAVGTAMLVAAVRRVQHPGTKHDCVPILQGPQGAGKSTVLKVLFGQWFSDMLSPDLAGKDAAQSLAGLWGLELSEIDQVIRSDVETVKAFVSRQVDRYRPPYARAVIETPRQCVLIGTTNSDDYLRDATGNRRFWPIMCPTASPEWVEVNRDQLWAEAAHLEADGAQHWLQMDIADEAEQEQASRLLEDTWQEAIQRWAEQQTGSFTTFDALRHALDIPVERQTLIQIRRTCKCLRAEGWTQHVVGRSHNSRRLWTREA